MSRVEEGVGGRRGRGEGEGGRRRDGNCRAEALRLKGTCARGRPKTAFSKETRCTSDTAQPAMASTSSTTFPVLPIQKFAGRNAPVRRPTVSAYPIPSAPDLWPSSSPGGDPLPLTLTAVKEITHFSYDDAHKLRHDHSSLRTYYTPRLDDSLSGGFELFLKHDDSVDEHLDGLLEALVELERKTGERVKADIVTWRGMMTKVCCFCCFCSHLLPRRRNV